MSYQPTFYIFAEDSASHKLGVCDSDFRLPVGLPLTSKFYIRTWSLEEMPSDLKVVSKGCKHFSEEAIIDEEDTELDLDKCYYHFTFFTPDFSKKEGFISITVYGQEGRISWVKQDNYLLVTDFGGRQAKVYPFKIEDVITEEERYFEEERKETLNLWLLKSKIVGSMALPTI